MNLQKEGVWHVPFWACQFGWITAPLCFLHFFFHSFVVHFSHAIPEKSLHTLIFLENNKELKIFKNYIGTWKHLSHWTRSFSHLNSDLLFHALYSEEVTLEGFLWTHLQPESYLKTCWRVTDLHAVKFFVQKPLEHKESVGRTPGLCPWNTTWLLAHLAVAGHFVCLLPRCTM